MRKPAIANEGLADMTPTERRLAKHARYNASAKGRARFRRYNRTMKRLKAQRERNQVRRERAAHRGIVALATRKG